MNKIVLRFLVVLSINVLPVLSAFGAPIHLEPMNVDRMGYTKTPFGRMHSSCVHRLPRGARVRDGEIVDANGNVLLRYGQCEFPILDRPNHGPNPRDPRGSLPVPAVDGYVETRNATNVLSSAGKNYYIGMEANVQVPAAPSSATSYEVVFLFPAFENSAETAILQPVLQFGESGAGGGQYYSIAPWYIDHLNHTTIGELQEVATGDTLDMYMYADTCNFDGTCAWEVGIDDYTIYPPVSSFIGISAIDRFQRVYAAALEIYAVGSCNQLPNSGGITFYNEHFYEPGNSSGYFYYQDVTNQLSWTSQFTGAGFSPSCSWGQSGVAYNSSTLNW
jgi:hypothetical protein